MKMPEGVPSDALLFLQSCLIPDPARRSSVPALANDPYLKAAAAAVAAAAAKAAAQIEARVNILAPEFGTAMNLPQVPVSQDKLKPLDRDKPAVQSVESTQSSTLQHRRSKSKPSAGDDGVRGGSWPCHRDEAGHAAGDLKVQLPVRAATSFPGPLVSQRSEGELGALHVNKLEASKGRLATDSGRREEAQMRQLMQPGVRRDMSLTESEGDGDEGASNFPDSAPEGLFKRTWHSMRRWYVERGYHFPLFHGTHTHFCGKIVESCWVCPENKVYVGTFNSRWEC